MWVVSIRLSGMVSKTKAQENLEQLQGSFLSSLQGDPKIIKCLKDLRLCSKRARLTSQCGTFRRDAAGPHPGSGEYCNGYTNLQNLGRAADKDYLRAIKPSRYPHRKTCKSAIRECPSEKLGHCSALDEHGHQASRNSTPSDLNSNQDRNVYSKSGQKIDPNGYKVEEAHTSATCRFPNNGHSKLATLMNIKGGKTCNK